MSEIIYVLINEAMPGYVKIGRTSDLEQRIRQLDTTSVPLPFECFYACVVKDAAFVEKQIHDTFLDSRVRSNREFFEMDPERAVSALKMVELKDITPNKDFIESNEDQQALDKARKRRGRFNFRLLDIPIGSELIFTSGRFPKPEEEIRAVVVDDVHIKIGDEITTVSSAAMRITNAVPLQGTLYWKYEGETLDERRNRLESE